MVASLVGAAEAPGPDGGARMRRNPCLRPIRFASVALAATLAWAGPGRAQQIVYDPTNYAKLIEQAQTALQQLAQLKSQVTQAQNLYASLNTNSGVNGIASLLNTPQLRAVLPDAQLYASAAQGNL